MPKAIKKTSSGASGGRGYRRTRRISVPKDEKSPYQSVKVEIQNFKNLLLHHRAGTRHHLSKNFDKYNKIFPALGAVQIA